MKGERREILIQGIVFGLVPATDCLPNACVCVCGGYFCLLTVCVVGCSPCLASSFFSSEVQRKFREARGAKMHLVQYDRVN